MIKLFKSSIPKLFIKSIPAQMFRPFFNYLYKKWTSSNCQNNTIDKLNVASGIVFVYITTVINYYYSL